MANAKYNPQHAGRADFDKLFTDHQMTDADINAKFTTVNLNIADINTTLASRIYAVEHEVQDARGGYDSLDERLDAMSQAGGATDYTELDNKPKINNVELTGNKTLADIGAASASDLTSEASARQAADTAASGRLDAAEASVSVMQAALAGQINTGAKNLLQVYTGSGTANVTLNADLSAGEYIMSFSHLESTDTDYETCQVIALQGNTVVSASPQLQMSRGDNVFGKITVTDAANRIQIYASRTGSAAAGDTVSFENAMLCTAADWGVSTKFTEYCPTVQELYQMILAMQSGGASTLRTASPAQLMSNDGTEAESDA